MRLQLNAGKMPAGRAGETPATRLIYAVGRPSGKAEAWRWSHLNTHIRIKKAFSAGIFQYEHISNKLA
jgi:hypothetical protein